ncbi:UNVERIFIED_CONTAM: hypothetical protein Sradi_4889900, partial [Sesamum radiatum]
GNTFTWHNYSTDSQSLWKRLDRMLVNNKWLELWLGTQYVSANSRTSDHLPLVLKGELQNPPVMLSRHWASRILSHEDGVKLTRPVSVEEIKLAFFDIAEDKLPGPDGYTTAFYKAAWPVVCGEITRAIVDFFTNGQLLK